jgi:hypothetical protein
MYSARPLTIKCLQALPNESTTHIMQKNSTHIMVDASTLTIDTALRVCYTYPQDGKCDICMCSLMPASPVEETTASSDTEIVITKVCGDKHHFHRACINAWFRSGTPHLNECPLDRKILYGTERVPQQPVNSAGYAEFPGHDPEGHEEFYSPHYVLNGPGLPNLFYSDGIDEWIVQVQGMMSFFNQGESNEDQDIANMPPPSPEEQIAMEAAFGHSQTELSQQFRSYLSCIDPPISFQEMFPAEPHNASHRRHERILALATYGYRYPDGRELFPILVNLMGPLSMGEREWLTHMLPAEPETASLDPFRTFPDSEEVPDESDDDHPNVRCWRV